jgi:hypothetical protein
MIIESAGQLLDILVKRPNKKLIDFGRDQRKRVRMHMYGIGMEEHLTMIKGFERPWLKQVRTKYVQSNKDLFARLMKPITKVFTARGGSSYYNLSGNENEMAATFDSNIFPGISTKKWLEMHWKTRMIDDPMGLLFMEIDSAGNTYPTYKSIEDIVEYKLSEGRVEYVVFSVDNQTKKALGVENEAAVYRVVDDMFDKIVVVKDTTTIFEIPGQTFLNYFGYVPAMTNSYVPNPDGDGFVTPFYWVLDLADQYLLKISIRITHEFLHGFPKYFEYADDCLECLGSGKIRGKNCTHCKGTGKKIMTAVSDVKLLEWPTEKGGGLIKGAPGGYIEPSKIFWEIASNGLLELEERINKTLWGSHTSTKLKPGVGLSAGPNGIVTATEVIDNKQPEIDALNEISDAAEKRDKFIVDSVVTIKMNKRGYSAGGGCSKTYGRRFLMEEPDALLLRYTDARKQGVSPMILFGLYEQYIEARYQSDGVSLSLHKKMMKVEPFMHYTLAELKLNGATPEDIRRKIFYGEWLAQISNNNLILASISQLQAQFEAFVSTKPLPVEEEKEVKPAASLN